ncbi:MAG: type III toxin-antitoxin system CptIN family toxin [Fusobacteriaceae bacterium]
MYWAIPLSSQIEKFQKILSDKNQRGQTVRGILIGEYDGREQVFLLQNIFPITKKFISHRHVDTKNSKPVELEEKLKIKLEKMCKYIFRDIEKNRTVFTKVSEIKKCLEENLISK